MGTTGPTSVLDADVAVVVAAARCWVCGTVVHKSVPFLGNHPTITVAWHCRDCQVTWHAPVRRGVPCPCGADHEVMA